MKMEFVEIDYALWHNQQILSILFMSVLLVLFAFILILFNNSIQNKSKILNSKKWNLFFFIQVFLFSFYLIIFGKSLLRYQLLAIDRNDPFFWKEQIIITLINLVGFISWFRIYKNVNRTKSSKKRIGFKRKRKLLNYGSYFLLTILILSVSFLNILNLHLTNLYKKNFFTNSFLLIVLSIIFFFVLIDSFIKNKIYKKNRS